MKAESKLARLLLVSPWTLLIFLVLPLLVILSFTLHIAIPLAAPDALLYNNLCFALLVACRLFRYLARSGRTLRYGAGCCRPRQGVAIAAPASQLRARLTQKGYFFDTDGSYGERWDLGYFGTALLYSGLFLLLSVGCWDNLRQFSGSLLDGMGPGTKLNKIESYRAFSKGPLAAGLDSLPTMHITSQTLPDVSYPKGATGVALTDEDGKTREYLLIPGQPIRYGAFDISMTKLVFQPQLVIKSKGSGTLFDDLVTLDPLVQKRGPYSFYGLMQGTILGVGVYYQPEKSTLMVVISQGDKKVVTDLTFQVDQQVVQGDYILSCPKMGQWSEIKVMRRRHKSLLLLGGVLAALGLLLRVVIRPERVWLEEAPEGCTVRMSDKEGMKAIEAKG